MSKFTRKVPKIQVTCRPLVEMNAPNSGLFVICSMDSRKIFFLVFLNFVLVCVIIISISKSEISILYLSKTSILNMIFLSNYGNLHFSSLIIVMYVGRFHSS